MSRRTANTRSLSTINRSEFDDAMLRNNSRFDNRLTLEMQRYERDQKTIARDLEKEFKLFIQRNGVASKTKTSLNLKLKPVQREKTLVSNASRFIPDYQFRNKKREKTRPDLEVRSEEQGHGHKVEPKEVRGPNHEADSVLTTVSSHVNHHQASNVPPISTVGVAKASEEAGTAERSSTHPPARGNSGIKAAATRRSSELVGGDSGHAHLVNGSESGPLALGQDLESADMTEADLDWLESDRASKFSLWSNLSVPKHRNTALAVRERLSKEFTEGTKQSPSPKRSTSQGPLQALQLPNRGAPHHHHHGRGRGQRSIPDGRTIRGQGQGPAGQGHLNGLHVQPAIPRHLGPLQARGGGGRGRVTPRGVDGTALISATGQGSGGLEPLPTPRPLGVALPVPLPAVTGHQMQRQRRDSTVGVNM